MSGYTIDQLLRWTLEDQLIDGYAFNSDGHVEIYRSGRLHVMERKSAEHMLRDLIVRISTKGAGETSHGSETDSTGSEAPAGDP